MKNKLEKITKYSESLPCAFSDEEMLQRLIVAEKDFEIGKGVAHEYINRK